MKDNTFISILEESIYTNELSTMFHKGTVDYQVNLSMEDQIEFKRELGELSPHYIDSTYFMDTKINYLPNNEIESNISQVKFDGKLTLEELNKGNFYSIRTSRNITKDIYLKLKE